MKDKHRHKNLEKEHTKIKKQLKSSEKQHEKEVKKKDKEIKQQQKQINALTDLIKSKSFQVLQKTTIDDKILKETNQFRKEFTERLLKLVTSGFGLVSALAWNELIKEFVKLKIKPYFGESSGLISLLIYAVIVTLLAVLVTYNLGKIQKKEE